MTTSVDPATLDFNYYIKKYIAIIGAYIFIVLITAIRKNKISKIIYTFTDKWMILGFLIMVAYLVYGFVYSEDEHFRDSVMAGFTAFIIAVCAKLDLIFFPFFIIFTLKYYVPSSD